MLVRDGHALQTIDLLDLVHQVCLQFLLAEHRKDVVRVERTIHQRLAGAQAFAFLHVDVNTARHRVLLFLAVICRDVDLALTLGDFTEADDTIDLADDGRLTRLAGFEELDHARQTARDVLGAGGFARDLGQDVSGEDLVAILHHEVRTAGHQVALVALGALDEDGRLALLIRSDRRRPDATDQ